MSVIFAKRPGRNRYRISLVKSIVLILTLAMSTATFAQSKHWTREIISSTINELPPGGRPLFNLSSINNLRATAENEATVKLVDADIPGGKAFRFTIPKPADYAWEVQLSTPPGDLEVGKGEIVYLTFWVRAVSSQSEDGLGRFTGWIQKREPEWKKLPGTSELQGTAAKSWEKIHFAFIATEDALAGFNVSLQLGSVAQIIEIGGLFCMIFPQGNLSDFPSGNTD